MHRTCGCRRSAARWLLGLGIAILFGCPAVADERFTGWFADGTPLASARISAWPVPGVSSRIAGRNPWDSKIPLRFLRDSQVTVAWQPPYLLLANGDCLPGTLSRLAPADGRPRPVPRVNVQLEEVLPLTGTEIAVRTDRIARIIGSSDAAHRAAPPPGTVELVDGRRFLARSIKWREYGLALLTAEGVVEAAYSEIADAVLPDIDRAAALVDDSRGAASTSAARSTRYQLAGGGTITASRISREQERVRRRGRQAALDLVTYHYVQPAWSDHPLAIAESQIAWCSYRTAGEIPLALAGPELVSWRPLVGVAAASDRSLVPHHELAATGSLDDDLALRTRSYSELAIDLPDGARTFETAIGFERAVATGGCVRCRVLAIRSAAGAATGDLPASEPEVLWDSGVMQGSDGLRSTGPLPVAGVRRLVLVTDPAHDDRPAGADPLDIRDDVVWLAPRVILASEGGPAANSHELADALDGLAEWELVGDDWRRARSAVRWNRAESAWQPLLVLPGPAEYRLRRPLSISRATDVLELQTICPAQLEDHTFELRVAGQPLGWFASSDRVQLRNWVERYAGQRPRIGQGESLLNDRLSYWWDLSPWRGQEVTLELTIRSPQPQNAIVWHSFSARSAIANLPPGGEPLTFDVPLTSLEPFDLSSHLDLGNPMRDALPTGRNPDPIRFLGQRFAGGYGLMMNSSISFRLAPEYRKFVAVAGCSNLSLGPLQVLIDGQPVWQRDLMSGLAPAEQLEIDLPAGAKVLTLTTGDRGLVRQSYAAWTEAGFVTER
ncbi:MAG: NPCBM/NEW2 domain-containing protein [Pirellulaceae bacterium]|nr:NPCBM/NEW2 domain-containing protein [Pirellulaceae bacterium]